MDFDGAIQAHTNWKLRLFSASKGVSKEKIDIPGVERDDNRELGKWLHGDAKKSVKEGLDVLSQAHAQFHRCAAGLARQLDDAQNSAVEKALTSPDSEFNKLSMQVVGKLSKLRREAS